MNSNIFIPVMFLYIEHLNTRSKLEKNFNHECTRIKSCLSLKNTTKGKSTFDIISPQSTRSQTNLRSFHFSPDALLANVQRIHPIGEGHYKL